MPHRSAIVVVIDRFGAGYLGPYGNTWIETPTLNRMASQSLLFEHAYADRPTLDGFYRAVDSGQHAWSEVQPGVNRQLISQIASQGIHSMLVTDEPQLDEHPFASSFHERQVLSIQPASAAAGSIETTQMAQTCAAAVDSLEEAEAPFLLWLHLRGMSAAWDAPRAFREGFADSEDPAPPDLVEPPDWQLPENTDPDEILGMTQAYAGQVALLDMCLAPILELLENGRLSGPPMLIVTAPRGFPLAERGRVGACGDGLFEEVLHVPLVVRLPDGKHAMERCQSLVQPADLFNTLLAWFGSEIVAGVSHPNLLDLAQYFPGPSREAIVAVSEQQRSLRTAAWFFRESLHGSSQLFAKPDDRWEVNDVAGRCAEVVEESVRALAAVEQFLRNGGEWPSLPSLLLSPSC